MWRWPCPADRLRAASVQGNQQCGAPRVSPFPRTVPRQSPEPLRTGLPLRVPPRRLRTPPPGIQTPPRGPLSGPSWGRPNNNDPKGCPCPNSLSPRMAQKNLARGMESRQGDAWLTLVTAGSLRAAPRRWGDVATGQRTPESTGVGEAGGTLPRPLGHLGLPASGTATVHFRSFKPPSVQPLVVEPMGALKEKAGSPGPGISQAPSVD